MSVGMFIVLVLLILVCTAKPERSLSEKRDQEERDAAQRVRDIREAREREELWELKYGKQRGTSDRQG
jgi:hypothetical protein